MFLLLICNVFNEVMFYHQSFSNRCCNTCEDVRKAYRTKGWALKDPDGIEQVSS